MMVVIGVVVVMMRNDKYFMVDTITATKFETRILVDKCVKKQFEHLLSNVDIT